MALAQYQCDGCGQTDDHPKLHYGAETYHHDCIPHRVMRDLTTTGYWSPDGHWVDGEEIPPDDLPPEVHRVVEIRRKAEGGTRGGKLRAAILKMHEEV